MTQIFIEPELENLSIEENAAEWFDIATSLGLEHQLKHADKSETKQAPPYMAIDPKTSRIIKTLCPLVVDYKKYSASTIPLDVLQEIKKCDDNGWYQSIKIAYDNKSPDPFVIGYTHSENNWDRSLHLIARWGAELLPFELLEEKAIARVKDEAIEQLMEMKSYVEFGLSNIELNIRQLFAGKELKTLSFKPDSINTWI
jgi:hypothetical protein